MLSVIGGFPVLCNYTFTLLKTYLINSGYILVFSIAVKYSCLVYFWDCPKVPLLLSNLSPTLWLEVTLSSYTFLALPFYIMILWAISITPIFYVIHFIHDVFLWVKMIKDSIMLLAISIRSQLLYKGCGLEH